MASYQGVDRILSFFSLEQAEMVVFPQTDLDMINVTVKQDLNGKAMQQMSLTDVKAAKKSLSLPRQYARVSSLVQRAVQLFLDSL